MGSGHGTFSTRGAKGQKARAGGGVRPQFEGGQTPLIRRQPKLGGFKHPKREEYEIINLDVLEMKLAPGAYDVAALRSARLLTRNLPVKVLGRGNVTKQFSLTIDAVSRSAREAIEKAGGSVTLSGQLAISN